MDEETVSVLLRMSARLRDDLRQVARENRRSLTAELVHRLEESRRIDRRRERQRQARQPGPEGDAGD
jgi:hypothetical protein